jgi:Rhs element Vgr protein
MADSPIHDEIDLPSCTVLIEGSEMAKDYPLLSIRIIQEINKISVAKLVLVDGDPTIPNFKISESGDFDPGKNIEIKLGYHQKEDSAFSGVVVSHDLRVRSNGGIKSSELIVTCKDTAFAMTLTRKSKNYVKKKDSDVIAEIINGYSGVTNKIDATTVEHPNLVQFNCTDWDFMLSRSDANGLVVINDQGKLTVEKPDLSGTSVLKYNYGSDVISFTGEMDSAKQLDKVEFQSWDSEKLALVKSSGSEPSSDNPLGDLSGKKLAEVHNKQNLELYTSIPEDTNLLKSWADAHILHSRLSKILGFVSSVGTTKAEVGKLIDLEGFGTHFNGKAYTTKVVHHFERKFWGTEVGFGLRHQTYTERGEIEGPSALGMLPGISGLHIGKVKKIDGDPKSEYRVQVDIPFIEESGEGIWARLGQTHATSDAGFYFYPNVGDEVVLGFVNNDPRHAVILGSLYGKKNKSPFTPEAENKDKGIITKNNLKITFDDKDKILILETPGGQKISLDDKGKSLKIEDQNKNSILLDSAGITLNSDKDITLKAGGKINITSKGVTEVKSSADFKANGINVTIKASAKIGLEGATGELKSSGPLTVKGAIVNIN